MNEALICTIEELTKELANEKVAKYKALLESAQKDQMIRELQSQIKELTKSKEETEHDVEED